MIVDHDLLVRCVQMKKESCFLLQLAHLCRLRRRRKKILLEPKSCQAVLSFHLHSCVVFFSPCCLHRVLLLRICSTRSRKAFTPWPIPKTDEILVEEILRTLPLSLVAHSYRPSSLCCRLSVSMSKLSSLEMRREMLLILSVLAFGSAADDNLAKEERELFLLPSSERCSFHPWLKRLKKTKREWCPCSSQVGRCCCGRLSRGGDRERSICSMLGRQFFSSLSRPVERKRERERDHCLLVPPVSAKDWGPPCSSFCLSILASCTWVVRHLNSKLASPLVCWVSVYPPEVPSFARCSIELGRPSCQKWVVAYLDVRCEVDRIVRTRREGSRKMDSDPTPPPPFLWSHRVYYLH